MTLFDREAEDVINHTLLYRLKQDHNLMIEHHAVVTNS